MRQGGTQTRNPQRRERLSWHRSHCLGSGSFSSFQSAGRVHPGNGSPRKGGRTRSARSLAARRGSLSQIHKRAQQDRKSTRLNSSHQIISYAVFCLKKKKKLIT